MYTSATNKTHSYTATGGENDAGNMSLKTIKVIFGNFGNTYLLTTTPSTPRHSTMCSHHYKSTSLAMLTSRWSLQNSKPMSPRAFLTFFLAFRRLPRLLTGSWNILPTWIEKTQSMLSTGGGYYLDRRLLTEPPVQETNNLIKQKTFNTLDLTFLV